MDLRSLLRPGVEPPGSAHHDAKNPTKAGSDASRYRACPTSRWFQLGDGSPPAGLEPAGGVNLAGVNAVTYMRSPHLLSEGEPPDSISNIFDRLADEG